MQQCNAGFYTTELMLHVPVHYHRCLTHALENTGARPVGTVFRIVLRPAARERMAVQVRYVFVIRLGIEAIVRRTDQERILLWVKVKS